MARLRPALEAAFAVARAGAEATPPVPAPPALRPFLSFRRLTGRALERAARVLDEDDAFRERVVGAVEPEAVGDAGWLFLERPDGWRTRLDDLLADAVREAEEAGSAEEVSRLRRELARAVEERDEAMEAARHARTEQDRAARALDDARVGRTVAEEQAAALAAQVAELTDERAAAVRDLKAVEVRANARLDELRRAQDDLAAARGEVAALHDVLAGDAGDADEVLEVVEVDGDPSGGLVVPVSSVEGHDAQSSGEMEADGLDRDVLAALVARAAEAAAVLSSSLAEVAELVRPADDDGLEGGVDRDGGPDADRDDGRVADRRLDHAPAPPAEGAAVRPARREPVPIPVGVFDDTPEAALHLLRHPGTTLAVDGYNVSLAGWPMLALSAQRRRLVDALEALTARTGCSAVVVFDGADVGGGLPGESRPRGVQVRFTAPDVEADDELLALLDALPVERPVTVASSDRRVADGARRRGASVIAADQLLALLDV